MADWGRAMFVTPGIVVDGELVTTDLVEINLGMRILLGSSFYDDWQDGETFVKHDPLGNPIDQRHPWNQTTTPRPQKRDFEGKYTWVMSPRWHDKRTGEHLALDTGGGPLARLWATALAGTVDYRPRQSDRPERQDSSAQNGIAAAKSNSSGRFRDGATRSSAIVPAPISKLMPPRPPCISSNRRWPEVHAGRTDDVDAISRCRRKRSAAGSMKRCAACCRTTW